MRRRTTRASLLFVVATSLGCGGAADEPPPYATNEGSTLPILADSVDAVRLPNVTAKRWRRTRRRLTVLALPTREGERLTRAFGCVPDKRRTILRRASA